MDDLVDFNSLSEFDDDDDETDKDITIKCMPKATPRSGPPRPTKSSAKLVGSGNTNRPPAHRRPAASKATTKLPKAALDRDSDDDWDADFEPVQAKTVAAKPKKKHLSHPSMDDISAFLDSNDLGMTATMPADKPIGRAHV